MEKTFNIFKFLSNKFKEILKFLENNLYTIGSKNFKRRFSVNFFKMKMLMNRGFLVVTEDTKAWNSIQILVKWKRKGVNLSDVFKLIFRLELNTPKKIYGSREQYQKLEPTEFFKSHGRPHPGITLQRKKAYF